ncbi:MAG TPA: malate dehydrogenase (quinone) [Rhodocyclaceae bacterium]|jgi:malate dehydrogenase (quinone)|nr:malate dehydrogenase (quinone) [Rhodocyclaceae bacterium]
MSQNTEPLDVLLVGAGIMSATLGVLLKELDPSLTLKIVEMRDSGAAESSNPWNNAGTGHAGLCEMNYTPQAADGSVNVSKAIQINSQFEVSKQFWGHLVATGVFGAPQNFINSVPHMCFVRGEKDVDFLKKRHAGMSAHHAFATMEYSEDRARMQEWIPLTMTGRAASEKLAVTRVEQGTDVNFGSLTTQLLGYLDRDNDVAISYNQRVTALSRTDKGWRVSMRDSINGEVQVVEARFVFLGGGGGALPLLQMSGIPEGKGFGGFPVSGQWLRCDDPAIVGRHQAKVYSRAEVGAPPMSVPHLDTRVVDGKTSLLFGPFAGFSTKFLKQGSYLDLFMSMRPDNVGPMLAAGRDNMDLTRYLVHEVRQSDEERMTALRRLYPEAKAKDWRLEIAGQRVQIIKRDAKKGGILQFGTEVVAAGDGSIAALLGASPGASVSVPIMLDLIERCFADRMPAWRARIEEIFPARETALQTDAGLYREIGALSAKRLGLV